MTQKEYPIQCRSYSY